MCLAGWAKACSILTLEIVCNHLTQCLYLASAASAEARSTLLSSTSHPVAIAMPDLPTALGGAVNPICLFQKWNKKQKSDPRLSPQS